MDKEEAGKETEIEPQPNAPREKEGKEV